MAKKATRAELEAEVKLLRRRRAAGSVASVLNNIIKWAGISIIAYFTYRSIDRLAGETTVADIGLRLIGNLKLSDAVAWILGGGGALYGLGERRLRRKAIERFARKQRKLEQGIDPQRMSSGLTESGETHPEDD
jgi:hypothetical protein